ncbi:Arm DNA-binding domain-containing protein [Ralstonia pseudosolanacearum]|uniref:Arm DNA-binding domain-containing protein n=1 Tax=Ralstonia pseudosolanacearum TaxID=1310165 RepID=UPI00268B9D1E
MPLTDTAIRNAKPSEKSIRLFDGGGLYIEVSPSGGCPYVFRQALGVVCGW